VIRHVAIVIPAANEEQHIGRCLAAIAAARAHLHHSGAGVTVRVVVVLDGCHDATGAIAAARGAQTVAIAAASVGAARRAGAGAALDGAGRPSELWLANTDADSQVPPTWLTAMTAEARRGAHLVLGTVLPGRDLGPQARAEWHRRHHLRDDHPHVHGANFGIRGDAYLALGGWPPLVTGEDAELARRAARTGHLRVVRTAAAPVSTSARRVSRAPRGFSGYLRAIDAARAGASA
jgi:glycosyltransferase involved in cell wall biosynthesis